MLPTNKAGLKSFFTQVPGIRSNIEVGNSGSGDSVVFRVYGQSSQAYSTLEGVWAGGNGSVQPGSHVDFNAVEGPRADGGRQRGNAAARPAGRLRDQVRRQRLARRRGVVLGRGARGRQHQRRVPLRGLHGSRSCTRCKISRATSAAGSSGTSCGSSAAPGMEGRTTDPGRVRLRTARRSPNVKKGNYYFEKALVSAVGRRIASPASTTGPTITNCGMRASSFRGNRWKRTNPD